MLVHALQQGGQPWLRHLGLLCDAADYDHRLIEDAEAARRPQWLAALQPVALNQTGRGLHSPGPEIDGEHVYRVAVLADESLACKGPRPNGPWQLRHGRLPLFDGR